MITKSWWENWRFRMKLAAFCGAAAAASASILPAVKANETARGWYFEYLKTSAMVESGFAEFGGRARNGQPHADWLAGICGKYPEACQEFSESARRHFVIYPAAAGGGTVVSLLALFAYFGRPKKKDEEHRRGARAVDAKQLRHHLRKEKSDIVLGGVPIPVADEPRNLLLAGSPGSGKSVAINTILKVLRDRGDRVIVVDAGGQFVEKWARAGDVLLNPFDARGRAWSPFAEGDQPWEIEAMARSLVPPGEGSDAIWQDLAFQVMSGLLEQLRARGLATNEALAHFAAGADAEALAEVLDGHPAKALVSSGSAATIGSILTNLTRAAAGFRYLHPEAGENGFSITDWVRGEGSGWLFLSYEIDQRAALKTIIASQLDLVCRAVLGLRPDDKRRVWLIVDELPLLGKVASIVEFLTNARKYGGCAVLGIQALSQNREIYGREGSQTMLACLPSQLILRTPDPETADMMSKLIGEAEISRHTESEGRTEHGVSKNRQEQIANTRVVMPAELQTLPDLVGYLNLYGDRPVARVKLEIPKLANSGNPPFKPRQLPPRRPFVMPAGQAEASIRKPPEKKAAAAPEAQPVPAPTPTAAKQADGLDWS